MPTKEILISFFFICFHLTVNAQNCNDAIHTGEGTFYGGVAGSEGGNCSLPVAAGDALHCALNTFDYNNSNACGACIEVSGSRGKVILKVVDRCPECAEGDVDMTEEAFAMIADPIDGRVPISWKYVPCQTSETIKINFKEGSSEFWTAIQFRDIEHGISTMEYLNNSDQWIAVNRELFNFFIETSGISSPMTLRATSVLGEQLIFEDIILDLASDFDTGKQFSTPQECLLLSTPDFATKNIVVYPNPTSEKLYIINNTKNWVLSDSHGKKITEGNANFINTFTLESGLYFLSIDNKKAEKIIVK